MMRKILLMGVLVLFVLVSRGQALVVNVSGNASFGNSMYAVTEAGLDFPSSLQSETSLLLSVEYENYLLYLFVPNKKWRIFVHKSDTNWNNSLKLAVRRTGAGSLAWSLIGGNTSQIADGSTYQNISNTPNYFFRARHGVTSIPIQFRISDASLTMGAGQFETSVVFTVYDDW